MANVYYDFHNSSDFTPYVMGGVGWAHINYAAKFFGQEQDVGSSDGEYSTQSKSDSANNFAWALGVGVAWQLNDSVNIDLGYRYLNAGNLSLSDTKDYGDGVLTKYKSGVSVQSHDILPGARYTF